MDKEEILRIAQAYMEKRGVDIVLPGELGREKGNQVQAIFFHPLALEPGNIMCPPDARVWVDTVTGEVTWIEQM